MKKKEETISLDQQIKLARLLRVGVSAAQRKELECREAGDHIGAAVHLAYQYMLGAHFKMCIVGLSEETILSL